LKFWNFMTAGGKRIAIIAARWITESKERIDIDMLAIKAGQYIEVSTQITGWPTRTAKSPTARPPTTHSYLFPSISHGLSAPKTQ